MNPTTLNTPDKPPRLHKLQVWFANFRNRKTANAVRQLEKAFREDDGFVLTWKCNIAYSLSVTTRLGHDECNVAADELMRRLFGTK